MSSPVRKRSIVVARHKTSISLEDAFFEQLKAIAEWRRLPLSELVAQIDARRTHGNLSSAIRTYVLEHFVSAAREAGLTRAMAELQAPAEQGRAA